MLRAKLKYKLVMLDLVQREVVLITGINGYLASNTGMAVLRKGYVLRGTCRSRERVQPLMDGAWKDFASNIEIFEVSDICVPTAFDEAVKGVNAIIHMAAPVISANVKKASQLIQPTIDGTVIILNSALGHAGPQLETFCFTSSAAACSNPNARAPHTYNDESWNEVHPEVAARQGDEASLYVSYPAAKIAAEKAVWAFKDARKPHFAMTSICGSIATGPPIQLPSSPLDLPLTVQPVYKALMGKNEPGPQDTIAKIAGAAPYVDVRDLATIYLWAVEHPRQADGQRYLVVAGHGTRQAIFDILRAAYPDRREIICRGSPGEGYNPDFTFDDNGVRFDSSKVAAAIGLK